MSDAINPKDAVGLTKVRLWMIPPASIIHEAQAMEYGAYRAKRIDGTVGYGPFNWRENAVKFSIYYDALQRHMMAFLDGETHDKDSGVHHLGHAKACLGILLDALEIGKLIDDRPLPGNAAHLFAALRKPQESPF